MDVSTRIIAVEAEIADVKAKLNSAALPRRATETDDVLEHRLDLLNQQLAQWLAILAQSSASGGRPTADTAQQNAVSEALAIEQLKLEQENRRLEQENRRLEQEKERTKQAEFSTMSRKHSGVKLASLSKKPSDDVRSTSSKSSRKSSNSARSSRIEVRQQQRLAPLPAIFPPPASNVSASDRKYRRKLNRLLFNNNIRLRFDDEAGKVAVTTTDSSESDVTPLHIDISATAWVWKDEYYKWKLSVSAVPSGQATGSTASDVVNYYFKNRRTLCAPSNTTSRDSAGSTESGEMRFATGLL